MATLSTQTNLQDQAERDFWAETGFICQHSAAERILWPDVAGRGMLETALKLGPLSQEPEAREELPLESHARVQHLTLDHLGVQKLVYLTERAWNVSSMTSRGGCHRRRRRLLSSRHRESFSFTPRDGGDDSSDGQVLSQLDLRGVRTLEIFCYNDFGPWTSRHGDTVVVMPVLDPQVQKQLICLLNCMPSLQRVKVARQVDDKYLVSKKTCITMTQNGAHSRDTLGAAVVSDLEKADRQAEKLLNGKLSSSQGKWNKFGCCELDRLCCLN